MNGDPCKASDAFRVVVTREPEWDDESRDWANALTAYDDNKCPVCGGQVDECSDPKSEWTAEQTGRCRRATALANAQKPFFAGDAGEAPVRNPQALLWAATRKQ